MPGPVAAVGADGAERVRRVHALCFDRVLLFRGPCSGKGRRDGLCGKPGAYELRPWRAGVSRQMRRLPEVVRRSLTFDRGLEMACYSELERRLKIDIWFCDPYSPWKRGSNENTNGPLRQFLPKGADLSARTQRDLDYIATLMNDLPRKTLGWRTPAEALAAEIAISVAIGT